MVESSFIPRIVRTAVAVLAILAVVACKGGDDGPEIDDDPPTNPPSTPPTNPPPSSPPPTDPGEPTSKAFGTRASTARFLTQATFGPTKLDLDTLVGTAPSDWVMSQFNMPATLNLPRIRSYIALDETGEDDAGDLVGVSGLLAFWYNAITGPDQLRQRVAFALSEILVVSNETNDDLGDDSIAMGYYQDVLVRHAFGNYRDLIEDVTYAPAMGHFLTYMGNVKGNPDTGRMPDENYARELMQLFTIGLNELEMDGTQRLDGNSNPIETYDNRDVTGLAKVFTGLSYSCEYFDVEEQIDCNRESEVDEPLQVYSQYHSTEPKSFLGLTIPANTPADESIKQALDHIFNQPSVAPFISRQLIQRLVTSHPSGDYIRRVANTFEAGRYSLPDGRSVGDGRRGDMKATITAILFDEDARTDPDNAGNTFGKVREPVIRFTNWARAFDASTVSPEVTFMLWEAGAVNALSQQPYGAPSVFNFFRPGYVAPGTETGKRKLTMPEMQLVTTSSIPGYTNFMAYFVFNEAQNLEDGDIEDDLDFLNGASGAERARSSFIAGYQEEIALANNPQALVDHLDLLLTYGTMSDTTKEDIVELVRQIPLSDEDDQDYDGPMARTQLAVLTIMTSPDYLVQQ